jgi:DNA polymerase-3 subunit delta'
LKSGSFSHAYLFVGPKSVGKYTTAIAFARTLLCDDEKGCGVCRDCSSVSKNIHPDFYNQNSVDSIKIKEAREIKSFCSLKPYQAKRRVIVIKDADRLTTEAANSMLKILEEPEGNTVFVLTTSNIKNIMETIISRCQIANFHAVNKKDIQNWLETKGYSEGVEEATHLSMGKPGLALKALESEELRENEELLNSFMKLTERGEYYKKFDFLESIQKREDTSHVLDLFMLYMRDILLAKEGVSDKIVNRKHKEIFVAQAEKYSEGKIKKIMEMLKNIKETLPLGINTKLYLEHMALTMEEGR